MRVIIPSLRIDLPVISRDLRVPGQGPDGYPPCDVALYQTAFGQPGQPGTTYLYAHAREGMFLPLLTRPRITTARRCSARSSRSTPTTTCVHVYKISG